MRARGRGEDGWVLVTAIALLAVTLALGMALLAIVDTQAGDAHRDTRADTAYNTAESVLDAAVATLGTQWIDGAGVTRAGTDAKLCGDSAQTYASSGDSSQFGTAVAGVLQQAYGGSPGDWTVNVCAAATGDAAWSESWLTSRVAHATSAAPTTVWVRAKATVDGITRTVVEQARASTKPLTLPAQYAVVTGGFASDLTTATSTVSNSALVGNVLNSLLGGNSLIGDPNALVGVRCGLLQLLSGQLCLTGGLAGVASTVDALGLHPLNGILGTDRNVHYDAWRVAPQSQLDAYKRQAQSTGVYVASLADGADCMSADAPGQVVYIEQIGSGTGTCVIRQAAARTAKLLVVGKGKVEVRGPGSITSSPTFTGVIYAANNQATTSSAPAEVVRLTQGGWVKGQVFVDGPGTVNIRMPPFSLGSSLCNLLGLVTRLACLAVPVSQLTDWLLGTLSLSQLISAIVPQLSSYTAIQQDTTQPPVSITVPNGAAPVAGTFRQIVASG